MSAAEQPTNPILDAARSYANHGWRVIPIIAGQKRPSFTDWPSVATVDPDRIANWWGHGDRYGVGIVTGAESGIWVLDVDVADGKRGMDSLGGLEAEYGDLPDTVTAVTGSGGYHHFFTWPDDGTIIGTNGGRLGPGLDVRGEGGQVVAAPTIHPNGTPYRWAFNQGPSDRPVAAAPPWLLELLRPVEHAPAPTTPTLAPVDTNSGDDSPAAWFNDHTTWPMLLQRDGWTLDPHTYRGGEQRWVRPGKGLRDGISATVGHEGRDVLKVFTSSVPELDADGAYSRFGYQAAMHHGGDRSELARQIRSGVVQIMGEAMPQRARDDLSWVPEMAAPTYPPGATVVANEDELAALAPPAYHFTPGGDFILDAPDEVPAIWGADDRVLWAAGESLVIVGPAGVGKTTITGQIVQGLIGLGGDVLGQPIAPTERRVLYLASDRPSQISRAFGRLYGPDDRDTLNERLWVWKGPPPADIATDTGILLRLAHDAGASVVVLDSLKDMAIGLSDDTVGAGVNRAIQTVLAAGIDVLVLHHQRKAGADVKPPKDLASVYGSTWITAGAGSVILIWGEPGDAIVELRHLKQPAAEVGPLQVEHDQVAGTSSVFRGFDLLRYLRGRKQGTTVIEVARAWFEKQTPTDNEQAKARRKLDALATKGLARKEAAEVGGAGGSAGARYHATDDLDAIVGAPTEHLRPPSISDESAGQSTLHPNSGPEVPESTFEAPTPPTPTYESAGQSTLQSTYGTYAPEHLRSTPPLKGGGECSPDSTINEDDPYADLF